MRTILLKFAGPLQSWGNESNFETRYTDFYPSKSAVIGMVAASLGYRREEEEKLEKIKNLEFAVRVDQIGNILRDYHTAKKYKNGKEERTYVTNRYYLEDFVFVVALGGPDDLIEEIHQALENPYFQQYLGRRSLPLTSDFIIGLNNKQTLDSLKELKWQGANWYKKENNNSQVELEIYADSNLIKIGTVKFRKDKVETFSQKERKFSYRGERKITTNVENDFIKKEGIVEYHNALEAIGGDNVSI